MRLDRCWRTGLACPSPCSATGDGRSDCPQLSVCGNTRFASACADWRYAEAVFCARGRVLSTALPARLSGLTVAQSQEENPALKRLLMVMTVAAMAAGALSPAAAAAKGPTSEPQFA